MPVLVGRIETEKGVGYLAQLCKHFAHKIEARYEGNHGRAEFVHGPAIMEADATGLTIRFEVKDPAHLRSAKQLIDNHIARFAFREKIEGMMWEEV